MAERVILHIGSMKSGTSFIQNVLGENRDRLADHGVSFAGSRWRDQVKAVQELTSHGGPGQPPLPDDGRWLSLARSINETPGTTVFSMEFLGPRSAQKIDIIRDTLDGEIDAVLTCRDLARNIVAMWQEDVQNGATTTWDDFRGSVRDNRSNDRVARTFWKHQGLAQMAARWSKAVGPEHFTLVTVPQKGAPSGLLWERFSQVLGIPSDGFVLDVSANTSIGLATALTLRGLNERLLEESGGEDPAFYDHLVKHMLSKRSLAGRRRVEPSLGLDEKWVVKRGTEEVARLRAAGHRVVGDLDELIPRPVPGVHPSTLTQQEQYDAAMAALTEMVKVAQAREAFWRERIQKLRRRRRRR